MKKLATMAMMVFITVLIALTITACGSNPAPDADLAAAIEALLRPNREPEAPVAPPPAPTPATPAPTAPPPPPTPAPPAIIYSNFPFSFTSLDLYGNTVTERDLGEKDLFVAYLWAVW